jgi:sugar/nucleoside kinase (ribokinase family)
MKFPFNLRTNSIFDVVGFGTNAVDYLIRVPHFPKFGSKIEVNEYSHGVGGEAASTMVGLSRLGLRTAYAGRFGGDSEGSFGLRSLADEGVDSGYTEIIPEARTQIAFIVIDELTGERTIMWQRDKRLAYTSQDAPVESAAICRVLHMTPHDASACIQMATVARENGVIVSLDIDNVFDGIDELLPLVDICIASEEFPKKLFGASDHKAALRQIANQYGCSVTGLTLGRAGSIILCEGEFVETPGFDVPGGCVDTTGAGDAFRTGFLYGVLKGRTVEESSIMANAVAALKCRGLGARSSLPNTQELTEFLDQIRPTRS